MSEQPMIEQTIATTLPAELRPCAADLAALLDGLAPDEVSARIAARPVLGAALTALVGQTLDVAGRELRIAGNVATLQQVTISGGGGGSLSFIPEEKIIRRSQI